MPQGQEPATNDFYSRAGAPGLLTLSRHRATCHPTEKGSGAAADLFRIPTPPTCGS